MQKVWEKGIPKRATYPDIPSFMPMLPLFDVQYKEREGEAPATRRPQTSH